MTVQVALIRASNDTPKLPMTTVLAIARDIGLKDVTLHAQSANLVFRDDGKAQDIAAMLSTALGLAVGSPPEVIVRSLEEMELIIQDNPFAQMDPADVIVRFYARPLPANALFQLSDVDRHRVVAHATEIYEHAPVGSEQKPLPTNRLRHSTKRSIATIERLIEIAHALEARA